MENAKFECIAKGPLGQNHNVRITGPLQYVGELVITIYGNNGEFTLDNLDYFLDLDERGIIEFSADYIE